MGPERYPMEASLRPQAFETPDAAVARVAEPIVESVFAPLPELQRLGFETVATPVRGQRNLVTGEAGIQLGECGVQSRTRRDRAALLRRPGADPSLAGTGTEVREG